MSPTTLSLLLLTVAAVSGVTSLVVLAHRDSGVPVRRAIVVVYLITYVVSGYAHVLGLSSNRGYYEAAAGATSVDRAGLVGASLATLVGLWALLAGLWVLPTAASKSSSGRMPPYSLARQHPVYVAAAGGVIIAGSAYGLLKVRAVVASMGAERVIAVDGGMARFANLAQWLPWGVVLVGLTFLARKRGFRSETWNTVIAGASLSAGYVSSSWAGGRTDILLFALPTLAVILPHMPRLRWPLLAAGTVAGVVLVRTETLKRSGVSSFDVWDLFDWQFGRFSMLAFAFRYVDDHGLLGGETLLAGYTAVPAAILHLLGISSSFPTLSIVQVTGREFNGSEDFIFMVPGMSAELFMNLGYAGLIGGYVVLGLIVAMLGSAYATASGELTKLSVAYILSVILVHSVTAQSGAAPQIIFFGGVPLFVFAVVEQVGARRATRKNRAPRTGGAGAEWRT